MQMKEDQTIEAHLKSMKEMTSKLAAIGSPIPEDEKIVNLLASLPSSYSSMISALQIQVGSLRMI